MAVFNAALPILPGKVEAARAFAAEVTGGRREDFDAMQRRQGITRETWSIQDNPDGDALVVVWFECDDLAKALEDLAQDQSDAAIWFRERVKEINGFDITEPIPAQPELVLDWRG